jgi:hypothetical protein
MSGADYQNGLGAGYAIARKVRNDANAAVSDWASYSAKLESQLLTEKVERQVSVDYVKELRKALRELAPNHPLLQDENATNLFKRSRIETYLQNGYEYNVSSGQLNKINSR